MKRHRVSALVAVLVACLPTTVGAQGDVGQLRPAPVAPQFVLVLPPPPPDEPARPALRPGTPALNLVQAQLPPPGWQPTPALPAPPPPVAVQLPPENVQAPPPETVTVIGPELIEPIAPPPKIWEGSFELGLSGSEGNSENFNLRLGAKAKRKTPDNELSMSLMYVKNTQNGKETANRAFMEGRNEWLQPDSPWTKYVHGTGEYDEFRAFDFRIAMDAGYGYTFVKNPITTLSGRFGPGFSQEIGGPDDDIVPEGVLGAEFEHKLSDRQKISASTTFYPDLSDLGEYRCNSKASWELVIDPAWNLSLQLSVLDRYDSTPNGAKPNDLDYTLLLLWSF